MTDKEHGITVKHPAGDWREIRRGKKNKTIPDVELMNIFIAQKQFTEDWNNTVCLAYSAFLS